ncbi:MAG: hypothetical protein ACE147_05575 [Candidatus Methylomirabilales bacterium]
MKREYWIALVVAALIVGIGVGYGIWGSDASQLAELNAKVAQLSQENADLKAKSLSASAAPAPASPAPGASEPAPQQK